MKWTRKISLHFFHSFTKKKAFEVLSWTAVMVFRTLCLFMKVMPFLRWSCDWIFGSSLWTTKPSLPDGQQITGRVFLFSGKFISFELPLSDSDALKFCSSLPSLARNRAESTRWPQKCDIAIRKDLYTNEVSLFVLHKFAFFLTNDNINIIFGKGELDVADQNWMLRTVRNLWRKIIGFFKIVFFKNIFDSEKKTGIFGIFGSSKFLP